MSFRATAARHPLTFYVVLAFGFSWACWSVPALGYRDGAGAVLLLVGGFGPLVAALVMTRLTGHSVKRWFAGLFRWRVGPRWYLFAIGVPITLAVLVTAEFALSVSSAGLRAEDALQRWDYILTLGLGVLTIWAGVALLIKLTDGRLGHDNPTSPAPRTTPLRHSGAPTRAPALVA